MKKFVVESVCTFYEIHVVEAENEEMAAKIAAHSDYNASKWLGSQVANISKFKEKDIPRLKNVDSYFFEGCACVDADGNLFYKKPDGTINQGMYTEKIF